MIINQIYKRNNIKEKQKYSRITFGGWILNDKKGTNKQKKVFNKELVDLQYFVG